MTAQPKNTIKTYFETGDFPTEAQFVDLIDSYQDTSASLVALSSATVTPRGIQLLSATSAQVTDIGLAVLGAATSAAACNAIDAVKRSGDTLTGKLNISAGTSANAGINIGVGVSPASPSNGDMWVNASAAFIQVGASAYQIAPGNSSIIEATYNPTVSAGSSGNIILNTSFDTASYERFGNTVWVRGRLMVASVSAPTGTLRIALPFPVADLTDAAGAAMGTVHLSSTVSSGGGIPLPNIADEGSQILTIYQIGTTGDGGDIASQVQTGTDIFFNITYRAS